MVMVCYRLWKWYVNAYGNGMLPLMEMVCYRLWKWYVTAYGNGMLPLMEMVCYRLGNLSKLPNTVCNRFGQPLIEMVCYRCRQPKQVTQHSRQPLMEMVGNRFSSTCLQFV
jgi:hypothetical protein